MMCSVLIVLSWILLFLAPALLYVCAFPWLKDITKQKNEENGKRFEWGFHLDVEIPVYRHGLFWLVTLMPVYIAFIVALNMPHSWWWEISPEAFAIFFKDYKGVLWILGSSVAFSLGYGRLHNSKVQAQRLVQFDKSLKESQVKNDFDRRFKHQEEFHNFLELRPDIPLGPEINGLVLRIVPNHKLYGLFYPLNVTSMVQYEIDPENVKSAIKDLLSSIESSIKATLYEEHSIEKLHTLLKVLKSEYGFELQYEGSLADDAEFERVLLLAPFWKSLLSSCVRVYMDVGGFVSGAESSNERLDRVTKAILRLKESVNVCREYAPSIFSLESDDYRLFEQYLASIISTREAP